MEFELHRYMRRFNVRTAAFVISRYLEGLQPIGIENLWFRLNIYFCFFFSGRIHRSWAFRRWIGWEIPAREPVSYFVTRISIASPHLCGVKFILMFVVIMNPVTAQRPTYREKLGLSRHRLNYIPLKTNMISVSGHSSGAAAATSFYLSNSKHVDGIAIFSSITYQCGKGGLYSLTSCLRGRGNTSESVLSAEKYAATGLIDSLDNLKDKRHYIFHGTQDTFIHFDNGLRVYEFFKTFSKHVRFEQFDALHSVPSKLCGITCTGVPRTPGTGCSKCGFSVVFDGLNFIYKGQLVESTATICRAKYNKDGLTLVSQAEFLSPMDSKVSMLNDAVLYTPAQCRINSSLCSLHVAFHGCRHSIQNDGMDYIKCSGYLETADANNFIVLFPQVKQSSITAITLFHCWDLYGYTGPLYGTKLGSQNQVVFKMVSRIMNKDKDKEEQSVTPSSWNSEDYYYDAVADKL